MGEKVIINLQVKGGGKEGEKKINNMFLKYLPNVITWHSSRIRVAFICNTYFTVLAEEVHLIQNAATV